MTTYHNQWQTHFLAEGEAYTFSDYFKLGLEPSDAVHFHNYHFERKQLHLKPAPVDDDAVIVLQSRLLATMPYIGLGNEVARREFLIAPIVMEVVLATQTEVRTEFALNVSDNLRGSLDYLLRKGQEVVIVEAKRGDLGLGFTQLAVELIAVDQWTDSSQAQILGAVSVGDVWQFGVLDRGQKMVSQDLDLYTVPSDLAEIIGILVAALQEPLRVVD